MELYDDEYVKISIDENVPCIEWTGKKFMPSEIFRLSEEKSLEFYKKYKLEYPALQWYVDARDIGPVSPQDTEWIVQNILPEFAAAGLKREAFVIPKSALGRMAVQTYASDAGETVEIQMFDNVEAAKQWLRQS